jgi:hypothetical protein
MKKGGCAMNNVKSRCVAYFFDGRCREAFHEPRESSGRIDQLNVRVHDRDCTCDLS